MVLASAIATTVFVLGFLGLGIAVLAFAFSGGGRKPRSGSTPGGRKAGLTAVAVLTLAFGIALPAVGIAINADEQSKAAPGGVDLSASQQEGRKVFAQRCGTCHTLRASNSVGRVGPNLDEMRPPKALTLDAIAKGRARGMGQMPSGLIDGEEAENVAEFIEATAGR